MPTLLLPPVTRKARNSFVRFVLFTLQQQQQQHHHHMRPPPSFYAAPWGVLSSSLSTSQMSLRTAGSELARYSDIQREDGIVDDQDITVVSTSDCAPPLFIESQSSRICSILRSGVWDSKTKALQHFANGLSTNLVARVVNRLNDLEIARSFLLWAGEQGGYKHDTYVYNAYLIKLGASKQFDTMWELVDEMHDNGCNPDHTTFSVIIKCYGKAGILEECWKTMDKAARLYCTPGIEMYTALAGALYSANKVEKVNALIDQVTSRGLTLDTRWWSAIIHGLTKNKRIKEAMAYFDHMLKEGCSPDVFTYNSLISGFCEANCPQEAIALFGSMQRMGCTADVYTYNLLIGLHCELGDFVKAECLVGNMKASECEPNQVTYNTLLHGLLKKGEASKANEFFRALRRERRIDDASYRIYCLHLRKSRDFERLDALSKEMYSRYGNVDVEVCNAILQSFVNDGDANKAAKYFGEGLCRLTVPNEFSYALMINALCKSGCMNEAKSLLMTMQERGCKPKDCNYVPLMIELCRKGRENEAWKLFKDMLHKGVEPSQANCDFLLRSMSCADMAEAAITLCNHIISRSLVVKDSTIVPFVKCLKNIDKIEEAKRLIEAMQRRGCLSQCKKFKRALQVMLSGNVAEAEKFLTDPQGRKVLNTVSYSLRIRGCCKVGKLEEAKRLLVEMEAAGCIPDTLCYGPVIAGLSRLRRFEESCRLFEKMVGKGMKSNTVASNLMKRLCDAAIINEILKLGKHVIANGMVITRSSVASLSEGFSKPERLQEVTALYNELRENKCVKAPY